MCAGDVRRRRRGRTEATGRATLKELEWKTTAPWCWALGDFGSVHAPGGVGPWVAKTKGRVIGLFNTCEAARIAVEQRAHIARRRIKR